ncbi:MAG TPA: hypothetical protein VH640_21055 [Bryobacteraceae bacterium]|jgi:hypothetical protein
MSVQAVMGESSELKIAALEAQDFTQTDYEAMLARERIKAAQHRRSRHSAGMNSDEPDLLLPTYCCVGDVDHAVDQRRDAAPG